MSVLCKARYMRRPCVFLSTWAWGLAIGWRDQKREWTKVKAAMIHRMCFSNCPEVKSSPECARYCRLRRTYVLLGVFRLSCSDRCETWNAMFLQGDNANEVEYVRRRASKCKKTGSLSLHLRRPTSRLQCCCDLVQCGYLLSVDETNDFLLSCCPSQEESQNTPYLAQGWRSSNSLTKEPH